MRVSALWAENNTPGAGPLLKPPTAPLARPGPTATILCDHSDHCNNQLDELPDHLDKLGVSRGPLPSPSWEQEVSAPCPLPCLPTRLYHPGRPPQTRAGQLDRGLSTMSVLVAPLLLWDVETRPNLWMEAGSLLEPWANVTLTCQARVASVGFQLFKDGVAQDAVQRLGLEHRFPLGAVTSETRGLYRCKTDMGQRWTELSNLVEVSGADSLAPPSLSAEPVSWITPGLNTTLVCRGVLRGVTFLLKREGDDAFLEVAEAPEETEVTFSIHHPGNYSCSYRTHAAGNPSEPSSTVTVEERLVPPAPTMSFEGKATGVLQPGALVHLRCVAPLVGVDFQLRQGETELLVNGHSTTPGHITFDMNMATPKDSGLYTCRYRLSGKDTAWSVDSAPVELLLRDGTLPAPKLQAEPSPSVAPGALVRLECHAPRAGLRFALEREDARGHRLHGLLSPTGAVAHFELRDVSVQDSGNYSCVYLDPTPPFAGSARSEHVELRVDGERAGRVSEGLKRAAPAFPWVSERVKRVLTFPWVPECELGSIPTLLTSAVQWGAGGPDFWRRLPPRLISHGGCV
ncbi:alpha-1B-glycoprotein [Orycteropus afer afer]|uniref:Alpha-1B-glycoprotein n=1 Tax=Orycteropus afer afer TaxID=1230840 RepID=A0A8B7B4V1_ORYAF|nr:alpha-1B-glycoprotein [Orycteropus afer afer]